MRTERPVLTEKVDDVHVHIQRKHHLSLDLPLLVQNERRETTEKETDDNRQVLPTKEIERGEGDGRKRKRRKEDERDGGVRRGFET